MTGLTGNTPAATIRERDEALLEGWVSGLRYPALAARFGYRSPASVQDRVMRLRRQGWHVPRRRQGRASGMEAWVDRDTWRAPDGKTGSELRPVIA